MPDYFKVNEKQTSTLGHLKKILLGSQHEAGWGMRMVQMEDLGKKRENIQKKYINIMHIVQIMKKDFIAHFPRSYFYIF